MKNKPNTGYDKKKRPKQKKQRNHYIGKLLVANPKKVSFNEKIVKFLIFIALRLVIRPKKWKDPEKNYEIIDRTYKRIMSADFIFIPSSIAFYLIMAIMPILSLIMFLYQIPSINEMLTDGHKENIFINYSYTGGSGTEHFDSISKLNVWLTAQSKLHPDISHSIDSYDWHVDKDLLGDVLGKFVPGMSDVLKSMTDLTKSSHAISTSAITATLLSLVVSTWIAAGGFSKLVYTQSYMYEHKFVGGYWMNKFKGMFMVLFFSAGLFTALLVNILVSKSINETSINSSLANVLSTIFLVIGLFIGVFLAYIALFKFSPRYKIKIRHIIPGAMVSTIPTAGFLVLFGLISSLWSYGNYGAIGTIMYIGMASLIITYFIFVGLAANVSYYKTFVGEKVKTKWTISNK